PAMSEGMDEPHSRQAPGGHDHRDRSRHGALTAPALPDQIYTCPMHPQIRQVGPGFCPICGMALEPVAASLEDGPSAEYLDMRRRFTVSAILTVPLFVVAMARHLWPSAVAGVSPVALDWVELILATPVVLWGGAPFFARGWASLVSRHLNMF